MSARTRLPAVLLAALLTGACGTAITPTATPATTSTPTTTTSTTTESAPATARQVDDDGFAAIRGTSVALRAPEGMEVDDDLPGLRRPDNRTTIVVTTTFLPEGKSAAVALDEAAAEYAAAGGTDRGTVYEPPRRTTAAGHPAVAAIGRQGTDADAFTEVSVQFVADGYLVRLTAAAEPSDPLSADDLLAALSGARWTTPPGPGVEVTAAPGYQRVWRPQEVWLSTDGTDVMGVPKLVASRATGLLTVPVEERRAYAEDWFANLPTKSRADSVTEVSIGGHNGYEMIGYGPYTTFFTMLFTYDGCILVVGDFDAAEHPDQVPVLRTMTRSVVPV
ncbi:hypothetical protein [Actinosynnema sp. NPDC023587]|uniref:hypothetical protein n=1 Tax=Actinosynnema sp. NPDC023587 TaxID=3154695 RepID=UPI0033D272A6